MNYRKNPKNSDTRKKCCNYPKSLTVWFYDRVMRPKTEDRMTNSVDPDQSDLGLHYLPRPARLKTRDQYGKTCNYTTVLLLK